MNKKMHHDALDPFANLVLDQEEQALEDALAKGEYEEAVDFENTKQMLRESATVYRALQTAKPVTIRVNQLDLIKVKAKAKQKQIPYQTLLGVLIHDYADDIRELRL